jgi:putative endonuclease
MGKEAQAKPPWHIASGRAAEDLAAHFLEAQGLMIITRNFRCRAGELDLVCLDDHALVIVEIRQRTASAFGGAAASVTARKQRKLRTAAAFFLQRERRFARLPLRFDVLAIDGPLEGAPRIEWLRGAFYAE